MAKVSAKLKLQFHASVVGLVICCHTPKALETTTKASARASAGSQDGQLAHKTFVPHRDSAAVPSEQMSQKKDTTSSFRKFREALMVKKFEDGDNMPVEVDTVSGLYIGSYGAACNFQALKGAGITHILCVSPSLSLKFLEDFTYMQLQVADLSSVNISEFFDEALGFIDSALTSGGKVLVHCFMGISRSATIVLAYLIARQALTLPDALRELRRVRPQIKPNSGFYQELVAFDKKIHNKEI